MKIWYGYGSDHSANLVLIGHFKSLEVAQRATELLRTLSECARVDMEQGHIEPLTRPDDFTDATKERLRELNLYNYSPSDIADFALVEPQIEQSGASITLRTDEVDIGAFVKLMVDNGAKVEVYSAHDYPQEGDEVSEDQNDG